MSKNNLAIFIRSSSQPIPRVLRMMRAAEKNGLKCEYFGAMRSKNLKRVDYYDNFKIHRLGFYVPLLNGKKILLYFWFVLTFNISILINLLKLKPKIIHVSDFELFFSSKIYCFFYRKKLIYNIHDNLSQRYNIPKLLKNVLNFLEGVNVILSDISIVPESFRKKSLPTWCQHKVQIVKNSPEDPKFHPKKMSNNKINIFFGGWIDEGRGLKKLISLSKQKNIQITVAGEGDKQIIKKLQSSESIEYLGFLTHTEVINQTIMSDYVWALYDPSREINRFAASNKIAEALAVGRPIIINKELEVYNNLKKFNCLIPILYDDIEEYIVNDLKKVNQIKYQNLSENCRKAFNANYAWELIDEAQDNIYKIILR